MLDLLIQFLIGSTSGVVSLYKITAAVEQSVDYFIKVGSIFEDIFREVYTSDPITPKCIILVLTGHPFILEPCLSSKNVDDKLKLGLKSV